MNSMTLAFAMLLFGAALIYAGWTDRPLSRLLVGDHTTRNPGAAP